MKRMMRLAHHRICQGLALLLAILTLSSCGWRGIANMRIPGGPGNDDRSYTVYVQMADALAINANSKVMVADVFVGVIRKIELKNWIATLTLGLHNNVKLPKNATAKIGQTSLLGSQHIELAAPPAPSPQLLTDGDTIPLADTSAFPSTEQTLASVATVLHGGGIPNLEVISNEINNMVTGRGPQIRAFLGKLDTFLQKLNEQRADITHAIDSVDRLLWNAGTRADVLDRALTEFPPLIKHFADKQQLLINAVDALGRASQAADQYLSEARGPLHQDLQSLQCPLKQLGRAAPHLLGALKLTATLPFDIDTVAKSVRGDYINFSLILDTTLSTVDNAFLTGTGLSGALRALEQSFGRDPETMIPDVRYTTNPNDAPGGPLVERATC